jgi:pantoate--beta-alanine ligase
LCKDQGRSIGFVPTMGALHKGHLSLIEASNEKADYTVASIFVNPTQFNDKSDFTRYPRTEQNDLTLLESIKTDVVFIPDTNQMYGSGEDLLAFDFKGLDARFEGAHRPGHFQGVVTIVDKLFRLAEPDFVFMGEKDFQQLAIVKLLAKNTFPNIEIIGCKTLRETNGLAMSSRNMLLSESEREYAAIIYQTLTEAKANWKKLPLDQLIKNSELKLTSRQMALEYFAIVDADTLEPLDEYCDNKNVVALTAVRLGKVRLIDNLRLN